MKYTIKQEIYGFEYIKEVDLEIVDEHVAIMSLIGQDESYTINLVNVGTGNNGIEIPIVTETLLDIKEDSSCSVYCVTILNDNLDNSVINFGAPLVFNHDNKTMGQFLTSGGTSVLKDL